MSDTPGTQPEPGPRDTTGLDATRGAPTQRAVPFTLVADELMVQSGGRAGLLARMVNIADRMSERIVKIEVMGRSAEEMEIRRGAVKWAVIQRLMETVAQPGGKPMSYSTASSTEALGQDASYRDYLTHLSDLTQTIERLKYEQALDALNYRALIATLESTNGR